MLRKIRFRAIGIGSAVEDRQWFYGDLIQAPTHKAGNVGHTYCWIRNSLTGEETPVLPETVCQLVFERDGKMFFEGDICKGSIDLETGNFRTDLHEFEGTLEFKDWAWFVSDFPATDADEVIGTIHDHLISKTK